MAAQDGEENWRDATDAEILAAAERVARDDWHGALGTDVEVIRRCPPPESLADDRLRFLLGRWHDIRAAHPDGLFPRAAVKPDELMPILGYLMMLDVERDGLDARYRLYGSHIAEHAGRDWTGMLVSEMNRVTRSPLGLLYRGVYKHVHVTGEPVYTLHKSPLWLSASSWQRLILPVHGPDGTVVRFLVGNIPSDAQPPTHEEWSEIRRHVT